MTCHSTATVVEWWRTCRQVCSAVLELEEKYEGTIDQPVQIDESYFSGRRKYNRGRLLHGDCAKVSNQDHEDGYELTEWGADAPPNDEYGTDNNDWKWVVGIYCNSDKVRFIRVKNRTTDVLMNLIKKYVKSGSLVWTDEWKSYKALTSHGYNHQCVNHSLHYVDPITGAHTQGVQRSWLDCKDWYKRSRGNKTMLQGHLDEVSWRKLRSKESTNGTLFQSFIKDLGLLYCS